MFNLLIVSTHWANSGCTLHQVIAEFPNQLAADIAYNEIRGSEKIVYPVNMKVIKLY